MTETIKKVIGGPWLKLYRQYRGEGMSKEEAKAETEKVLGPMPPGTILKYDAPDEAADEFSASVEVVKVDEELGIVFGYGIICKVDGEPYYDLGGVATPDESHYIPEDVMLKMAADFMEKSRRTDAMHDESDHGPVVFAFPMTSEIAKQFGIETNVTGLMVGTRPKKETLAKFKSGEFTGFSIGGFARFEKSEEGGAS